MATVHIDIDDYLDEASLSSLLKEALRKLEKINKGNNEETLSDKEKERLNDLLAEYVKIQRNSVLENVDEDYVIVPETLDHLRKIEPLKKLMQKYTVNQLENL